jgi:porphobilinogen synthase
MTLRQTLQGRTMTFEPSAGYPLHRPRRLRGHPGLRALVSETSLTTNDLIYPLFVHHGARLRREIPSMPGQYQLSLDQLPPVIGEVVDRGIPAIILFGIPDHKDDRGSAALRDDGIIQQAIRTIKRSAPELLVFTDLCFCEYTDHGHCGPLTEKGGRLDVDNDATLPLLAEQAKSHARAGADLIAPSGMMDGMVQAIRQGLDQAGFERMPIMAYSAKFASGYYGPFREAASSAPSFGDRRSYQMDPANGREALREVALDLAEGADIVMVKPALAYLDIVTRVKETFGVPVAAYNVSGEYAMIKAAAANGWIDERRIVLETLTSIKRAGAEMILTYHALDVAKWLKQG